MTEASKMTVEQAIRLLDPATTAAAIAEIEYYNGFSGRTAAVQAISHACELACKIMREHEQVKAERDRLWNWIKGMGCETCSGDCDKCDGVSGWTWSGEDYNVK